MYAATRSDASVASSPKVPWIRAQRGSVARSTWGCKATRIPTARYSWRATLPVPRPTPASQWQPSRRPPATGRRVRQRGREWVISEPVAGITRERHRDTERPFCGKTLHLVVPLCERPPVFQRAQDVKVVHIPVADHGSHAWRAKELQLGISRDGHRMEHEPRFVLERESLQEVFDPLTHPGARDPGRARGMTEASGLIAGCHEWHCSHRPWASRSVDDGLMAPHADLVVDPILAPALGDEARPVAHLDLKAGG